MEKTIEYPNLKLNPLEKTAVSTNTKEDFEDLLQLYEQAGWTWYGGMPPSDGVNFYHTGICLDCGGLRKKHPLEFGKEHISYFEKEKYNILSLEEFCKLQNIEIKNKRTFFQKSK